MCRWTCRYYICGHRNYSLNVNGYCQRYRETRRRFCAAHSHVYYNICHEGEICPACNKAAMATTSSTNTASADSYAAYKLKHTSSGGIRKPKQQTSSRSAQQIQSPGKGKGMANRPRLAGSPLRQQC